MELKYAAPRSGLAINHVSKLARAARDEGKMMSIACNSLRDGPTKSNHGQTPMLQFLSFEDRNVLICFWKKEWTNPEISSVVSSVRSSSRQLPAGPHLQKLQGSTGPHIWPCGRSGCDVWGWSKSKWQHMVKENHHIILDHIRGRKIRQLLTRSHDMTGMIWRHQTPFFHWKDVKRHQGCNIHSTSMSHPPTRIHQTISTIAFHGLWLWSSASEATVAVKQCCSW